MKIFLILTIVLYLGHSTLLQFERRIPFAEFYQDPPIVASAPSARMHLLLLRRLRWRYHTARNLELDGTGGFSAEAMIGIRFANNPSTPLSDKGFPA